MKYRILSKEELEPLKDDFIKFLSANTITGEDWVKIKAEKPKEANKLLGMFCDLFPNMFSNYLADIRFLP